MPLNPILRQMFQAIPRLTPDVTPQRFREEFNSAALLTAKAANEPVHSVEDVAIPGRGGPIRARVYRPGAGDRLPAVVYYHGGGFVVGSIETHDHVCRRIARLSGAVVVSVDYRLAPEHKFPAAVEDAYDAAKWVADNRQRLGVGDGMAVAGDSAGETWPRPWPSWPGTAARTSSSTRSSCTPWWCRQRCPPPPASSTAPPSTRSSPPSSWPGSPPSTSQGLRTP